MVTTIAATTLRELIDGEQRFTIVDTRPADNFEEWRIPGAVNFPYKPDQTFDVDAFESTTGVSRTETVVTTCAKGESSRAFADELASAGYEDVRVLEDGMRAWAAVYDRVAIPFERPGSPLSTIVQIQRRAKGCLGYLIVGDGAAAAVDVSRHGDEWVAAAEEAGVPIEAVLDTHVHADHISGGRKLADRVGVPYYLPAAAAERGLGYDYEPLARNEVLEVGGVPIKAVTTPGHTSDMASYLLGTAAVLTGDTLFIDSVGRTELQFGDGDAQEGARQLYRSLHGTLLAEPDSVTVLPGHFTVAADGTTPNVTPGEPVATSIGDARTGIPVLAADEDAFVASITDSLPTKPPNYETVIDVNRGHDEPSDETAAIELELGPNRCAAEPASASDD